MHVVFLLVCLVNEEKPDNTVNYSDCAWLAILNAMLFLFILSIFTDFAVIVLHLSRVICFAFVYSASVKVWRRNAHTQRCTLKTVFAHLRRFGALDNIWLMSNPSLTCANPAVNLNISAQQYSFIMCACNFSFSLYSSHKRHLIGVWKPRRKRFEACSFSRKKV